MEENILAKTGVNRTISAVPQEKEDISTNSGSEGQNKKPLTLLGIGLVIFSCVIYLVFLILPLLQISLQTKAIISTAVVISAESAFWIGNIILGKEMVEKYKNYLNPLNWFKKKEPLQEQKEKPNE